MIKKLSFLLLFALASAFATPGLVKTKLPDGVTVSLPATMYAMTPDDIAQRYPSVRAPLGAFTDQDRAVDFSVNISATKWPDGDTDLAAKFFKSGLTNLYDRLDIISEGTQVIHKKKFIFFEFESRISGDRRKQGFTDPILKYTYIQYLVEKNRTLVFTFSCPKDQRGDWQETAKEIMLNVRVK
jgi:hypothetical protein